MKNGAFVTAWLDYCEETIRRLRSKDPELILTVGERGNESERMWQDLLAQGWTIAELDAAYKRRTGYCARQG